MPDSLMMILEQQGISGAPKDNYVYRRPLKLTITLSLARVGQCGECEKIYE